jgi:hypothetical protein
MFTIKGQICVSSFTRQAFKIKNRQAEGGSMCVYASEHLFLRLAQAIETNQFKDRRTSGSFIISGRVLVNFKLGENKPAGEAGGDE